MLSLPEATIATITVAIVLFVFKEVFELVRRANGDGRRQSAFRKMLARECELNHFTVHRLKRVVNDLVEDSPAYHGTKPTFAIEKTTTGSERFVIKLDGRESSSYPLPLVHFDIVQKIMIDAATLDQRLFEKIEKYYDSLNELKHVRDSAVDYISDKPELLDAFADYAARTLDEIWIEIAALYLDCAGKPLGSTSLRLR